jgi:hypothetical protein
MTREIRVFALSLAFSCKKKGTISCKKKRKKRKKNVVGVFFSLFVFLYLQGSNKISFCEK